MTFLVEGIFVEVIIVIAISAFMLYIGRMTTLMPLRRLVALDVIDEFIGRSVELGSPVLVAPAITSLSSSNAPATVVGLDMLAYVARLCAETEAELIIGTPVPDVQTISYEIYRDAYSAAGHPELYKEENVRYLPSMLGFRLGMMDILEREGAGCVMLFGEQWWENLYIGGSARRANALSLGSGAWYDMAAAAFVACDYTLMADEQYCAGAYVSQDPAKSNLLMGGDVIKWVFIILVVLGSMLMASGSSIILDLLQY